MITVRLCTCVKFVCGSKKIVSASGYGTVAVWEWEKSEARTLVLEGHSDWVRGVAVSKDGERIVSGSDDGTLRFWNGTTGLEDEDARSWQGSEVWCVDILRTTGKWQLVWGIEH